MTQRYVCIHGHFYQPPRENPWLESIELQDSAYPYHDWNERITVECYAPNAYARLLDGQGRIERLVNNYARISFNFGPTLLSWMEEHAQETYAAILAADAAGRQRYSGHGPAIAQTYNHMIMPLANRRDKETQVIWGIRDFEKRFGRAPEGMWLPETAVDVETLEVLAGSGIRYTILSPYQAGRSRARGERGWQDAGGGRIDPSRAYEARLPGNKRIALFFYDGPISRAVAFEQLLNNGEGFAQRLLSGFSDERDGGRAQLMHIATDGESYGHHHRHGEMALAYALHQIELNDDVQLTNYGEFLEKHPPAHEAEVVGRTAWSCVHGVGRWERDCGCNSGGRPGWNQAWRGPLRAALDWLRDEIAPRFEESAAALLKDPWRARNDYIRVILDRSPAAISVFLEKHAREPVMPEELPRVMRLMELQRHAQLMYTSCGWFFDELSGLETTQVIQYAARVIQLVQEVFDEDLEPAFVSRLAEARSNIPEHRDGGRIYERFARPTTVDLMKVAAHYATSSLFDDYGDEMSIFGYDLVSDARELHQNGPLRLTVGRVRVKSQITLSATRVSYAGLHHGDHNLTCGVREYQGEEAYAELRDEVLRLFRSADQPGIVRFLDKQFKAETYSLRSLFREEQRRIVNLVLEERLRQAETAHRQLYQSHAPLLRVLSDLGIPLPRAFLASVEFILNLDLRDALREEWPDPSRINVLLEESRAWPVVELDTDRLGYVLRQSIERLAASVLNERDPDTLQRLEELVRFGNEVPFPVDFSRTQNLYDLTRRTVLLEAAAAPPDESMRQWHERFDSLGRALMFRIP